MGKSRGSKPLTAWALAETLRLVRKVKSVSNMKAHLLAMRQVIKGLGGNVDSEARREALRLIDEALKSLGVDPNKTRRLRLDQLPPSYRKVLERFERLSRDTK